MTKQVIPEDVQQVVDRMGQQDMWRVRHHPDNAVTMECISAFSHLGRTRAVEMMRDHLQELGFEVRTAVGWKIFVLSKEKRDEVLVKGFLQRCEDLYHVLVNDRYTSKSQEVLEALVEAMQAEQRLLKERLGEGEQEEQELERV